MKLEECPKEELGKSRKISHVKNQSNWSLMTLEFVLTREGMTLEFVLTHLAKDEWRFYLFLSKFYGQI